VELDKMTSRRRVLRSVNQLLCTAHLGRNSLHNGDCITLPCLRLLSTSQVSHAKEYAFEMACSNIRYGEGVTKEVGMDCKNLGGRNVCVMTDPRLAKLSPVKTTLESLKRHKVNYKLYDKVRVEPSNHSLKEAIDFCLAHKFDLFVAVGGGSVMDTCKAANLYSSNPKAEFLDYVNAPIGKGLPVTHAIKPLIAVATTAGTGSETTGTAVFDYKEMRAKTGISSRNLRPTLGILDPLHLRTMPERVAAYAGIDVLCHAIESYTVMPYTDRQGQDDPSYRPAYQGNNPISDIWSLQALRVTAKYIKRAVYNADDTEARSEMLLASCFAGIGFGNAGTHLCHGMSYPISGLVKSFKSKDYDDDHPLVPHGLSVVITAPAVFEFTAPACPERHLQAAEALGVDIRNAKNADAGKIVRDVLLKIMDDIDCPNGIQSLGYTTDDIPALVKGTIPQHRVTKLSPRPAGPEELAELLTKSMKNY
jgi:hydroxyacid-oxoacid transhydrogenase